MNEYFNELESFLKQTLDGFCYLEWIEKGNVAVLLSKPSMYQLNHISAYPGAWGDDETIVIEFNGGIHFCFTPLDRRHQIDGLKYLNGEWQ
ncbi:hypothetical protein ACFYU8_18630 [Brevibacillus sp. NPDC003359]|uniref:hypothetical protein n=1 Tax=unclassified Brevibacillus TaxID=2684853 RepID=UPI0036C15558